MPDPLLLVSQRATAGGRDPLGPDLFPGILGSWSTGVERLWRGMLLVSFSSERGECNRESAERHLLTSEELITKITESATKSIFG